MSWKYKALLHAKREDPKESCGLLLNVKGKEKYFPCRNLSMTDHQCFIIDPEDYIKADNTNATADNTAEFPQEIYKIDRKSSENREVVEFELAAVFDLAGIRAPKRQCTRTEFPSIGTFIA